MKSSNATTVPSVSVKCPSGSRPANRAAILAGGSVARMAGYRDTSSFTRWFTAEFEMSPRQWRKAASELAAVRQGLS